MYRVSYDCKDKNGFLETKIVDFKEFAKACSLIRDLTKLYTTVGKPVLERI
jgi:hypothetical protein